MLTFQELQLAVARCRRVRVSLAKLKHTKHVTSTQRQVAADRLRKITHGILGKCEETTDEDYRQLVREVADIHDRCRPDKDKAFKKWIDLDNDRANKLLAKKEAKQEPKSDIARKYDDLGFESAETRKTPFDIVAKKEKEIVLTGIGDKMHRHLQPLSRLLEADRLIIFRKKKPKDTPALTKKEFLEFEKAKELIKFIKEF